MTAESYTRDNKESLFTAAYYEQNLHNFKNCYHSQCIFNIREPVPGLCFSFNNHGELLGTFTCTNIHQGYDGMVHGGILAAIIDASMTQCLMGHGVAGYTVDLSVKYCKPVMMNTRSELLTTIISSHFGLLYSIKSEITQNNNRLVQATARFFKSKKIYS
jgi:hypothetical protein